MNTRCFFASLFLALFVCLSPGPAGAQEASSGQVILVLDASGSMWGQIEGKTKIEIARESVAKLVSDWNPDIGLGLMAYGHRRKGDCQDIELVLPPAKADPEAFTKTVNSLNPKGKTPLSAAVLKAAEQLKYTEDKATVILVSDGRETCDLDPCKLASEMEAAGVDFTVHVIGFDVKKEEQAGLKCLADNTGGLFLAAENASGLHDALEMVQKKVVKEVKAEPPPKPAPEAGLKLSAVYAEGGPPVESNICFRIYDPEPNIEGNYKEIAANCSSAKPVFKDFPAGKYRLYVNSGSAEKEEFIEVPDSGALDHVVNLNAGLLKVTSFTKEGGKQIEGGLCTRVYDPEPDLNGNYKERAANCSTAVPVFTLTAGTYRLYVRHGYADTVMNVEVPAGQLTEQTVALNAGLLKVTSFFREGGKQIESGLCTRVYDPEPDLNGNYKERAADCSSAKPVFALTEGKYRLYVRHGYADTVTETSVTADNVTEQPMHLNAGYLKVTSFTKEGGKQIEGGLCTRVYDPEPDLNGNYREVAADCSSSKPVFALTEGKYRLYVKHGYAETATETSVTADNVTEQPMHLNAGYLKMTAVNDAGEQIKGGLCFRLYDPEPDLNGNYKEVAANCSSAAPVFTMKEGKYRLFVKGNNLSGEAFVDAVADQVEEIKVQLGEG